MEELLMELLEGECTMEIISDWQPMVEDDMGWWDRFWQTGQTAL